ncbi:MAG: hypothetical protein J6K05_10390 [Bacteroidaceae bacterium]|nr:hypothetical protein [Bacteroidaceae bacterium]
MAKITEYHPSSDGTEKSSVAFWQKHPMSLSGRLNQFKRLREQRLARESKSMSSENLQ